MEKILCRKFTFILVVSVVVGIYGFNMEPGEPSSQSDCLPRAEMKCCSDVVLCVVLCCVLFCVYVVLCVCYVVCMFCCVGLMTHHCYFPGDGFCLNSAPIYLDIFTRHKNVSTICLYSTSFSILQGFK